jgi:hypothetical protein
MSKKYKGTPKVSQSTIDSIKKMGMTASLKKAATSKNPMYLEGVKRMYGASRLTAAKKATASQGTSRVSPRVAERASATASRTSPRVAERKVTKSAPAKKTSKTTDPIARFVFGVGRAAAEPFKSKK